MNITRRLRAVLVGFATLGFLAAVMPAASAQAATCVAASVTAYGHVVPGTRTVVDRALPARACRVAVRRCAALHGHRRGRCEVLGVGRSFHAPRHGYHHGYRRHHPY